jgi:hypothetical protein
MANTSGTIHRVTDGGIAADHIEVPFPPAFVTATHSGKEHNTLKQSIIPIACWRAHDMRFKFDSSFVLPEIATEIGLLKDLIDSHSVKDEQGVEHKLALSVFAHADPTGSDDYNKALSGRRAQAIYALLTRKTELWEELFNQPGDHWGKDALGTMLDTVTPDAPAQPSSVGAPKPANAKPKAGSTAADKGSPADEEREPSLISGG